MPLKDMPTVSKQHPVPQNIMDVEFKLIGDLTMRQFAYLMMFGGSAYVAATSIAGIFRWPVVLVLVLAGLAFAFVPIQERGMDEWVVNFFRAVYLPTQRIWKKDVVVPSALVQQSIHVVKQELITLAPTSSRRKLEEYLDYNVTEVRVDPLDIPERDYAMKVQSAFESMEPAPAPTPIPAVGVSVLEPEEEHVEEPRIEEKPEDIQKQEKKEPEQKPEDKQKDESKEEHHKKQRVKEDKQIKPKLKMPKKRQASPITLTPITPDQHSGRRFVNLVPSGGELILPIRGEKVLRTSEELAVEDDVREKADKLQQLLTQIKTSSDFAKASGGRSMPPPAPPVETAQGKETPQKTPPVLSTKQVQVPEIQEEPKETERVSKEAERLVEKLRKENEKLSQEIEKLKQEIAAASTQVDMRSKQELLKKLEAEKTKKAADYSALQQQIRDLRERIKSGGGFAGISGVEQQQLTPAQNRMQSLTSSPNVVSGVVKDDTGKMMEGALLILKNDKGEPVRAFKTNTLGQFMLSTALAHGMYTIEVNSPTDSGLTFDIISVEAKGEVIPPVELVGKRKEAN